jgi:hypothetical protein
VLFRNATRPKRDAGEPALARSGPDPNLSFHFNLTQTLFALKNKENTNLFGAENLFLHL